MDRVRERDRDRLTNGLRQTERERDRDRERQRERDDDGLLPVKLQPIKQCTKQAKFNTSWTRREALPSRH